MSIETINSRFSRAFSNAPPFGVDKTGLPQLVINALICPW